MGERIVVTGANGFIGRKVCETLMAEGYSVRGVVREPEPQLPDLMDYVALEEIGPDTNWSHALNGASAVVHLAGRVHEMRDGQNAAPLYERVNTAGTRRLAQEAARAGIGRFVFLSTVKVNGEATSARPFTEDDTPAPEGPYALSKWHAEQALQKVQKENALGLVIIRSPLVYGPGVRANFLQLMNLVASGLPLPFGGLKNKRSLVGISNLAAFVSLCLRHHKAVGNTFLVSDGEDLSTGDLVRRIASALDRKARLVSVPEKLLILGGTIFGKANSVKRLTQSLQVSDAKARGLLGWTAPFSVDEELRKTGAWFLQSRRQL